MSDLPQEVTAAAMRALMVPEHDMVESVARAILAERERTNAALKLASEAIEEAKKHLTVIEDMKAISAKYD